MRKFRLLHLIAPMGALVAAGCVQTPLQFGSPVPAPAALHIEKDHTTEAQMVQRFGPPTSVTESGGDLRVMTWTGSKIGGYYNLAVTVPYNGASGDQQSTQHVEQTSLVATLRNDVVIDYSIIDRKDGNNWTTIRPQ